MHNEAPSQKATKKDPILSNQRDEAVYKKLLEDIRDQEAGDPENVFDPDAFIESEFAGDEPGTSTDAIPDGFHANMEELTNFFEKGKGDQSTSTTFELLTKPPRLSALIPEKYEGYTFTIQREGGEKIETLGFIDGEWRILNDGKIPKDSKHYPISVGKYMISNPVPPTGERPKANAKLLTKVASESVMPGYDQFNPDTDDLYFVDPWSQSATHISKGEILGGYDISTSAIGLGMTPDSNKTPTGLFRVVGKYGQGADVGEKLVARRRTGRTVDIHTDDTDTKDDYVTTRAIWLGGLQQENANTQSRYIYIHGTPEEGRTGLIPSANFGFDHPKGGSHGCIRMKNTDVVSVFGHLPVGAFVYISPEPMTLDEMPSDTPLFTQN